MTDPKKLLGEWEAGTQLEKYEEVLLHVLETEAWDEENRPKFVRELQELLDRYSYRLTTTYVVGGPAFIDRSGDRYLLTGEKFEP